RVGSMVIPPNRWCEFIARHAGSSREKSAGWPRNGAHSRYGRDNRQGRRLFPDRNSGNAWDRMATVAQAASLSLFRQGASLSHEKIVAFAVGQVTFIESNRPCN